MPSRIGFGSAFAQVRCDDRPEMVHPAMVFRSGQRITTPDQHSASCWTTMDSGRVERTTISDSELKVLFDQDRRQENLLLRYSAIPALSFPARQRTYRRTWTSLPTILRPLRTASSCSRPPQGMSYRLKGTSGTMALSLRQWWNDCAARRRTRGASVVMISDLEGYVSKRVKVLTGGNQRPMVAKPGTVEDFPDRPRRCP